MRIWYHDRPRRECAVWRRETMIWTLVTTDLNAMDYKRANLVKGWIPNVKFSWLVYILLSLHIHTYIYKYIYIYINRFLFFIISVFVFYSNLIFYNTLLPGLLYSASSDIKYNLAHTFQLRFYVTAVLHLFHTLQCFVFRLNISVASAYRSCMLYLFLFVLPSARLCTIQQ